MLDELERQRVARQLRLPGFGIEQQEKLNKGRVLVIGVGGLGSPALQSLAAAGVGSIRLVDNDTVDVSNIQRQILFGVGDVGRSKVHVAAERLRAIQPGIRIDARTERLTAHNAHELAEGCDVILDGSDTFATKFLCGDLAEITGIPLVWGSVLQFEGHMGVFTREVGLRDLFPEAPTQGLNCADAGVLGATTAVIANLMATETIKILAGIGTVQPGAVTTYNALTSTFRTYTVGRDPLRSAARTLYTWTLPNEYELIDVREPHEIEHTPSGAHITLPQSMWNDTTAIQHALDNITTDNVVVVCASGIRSAAFIEQFAHLNPHLTFHNVPSGINELP